jgi:UDP:flavonoid glycosyltransferase YjiC (YdhE family)
MKKRENILICPLNWGLGHASRCIPLIRILEKNQYKVFVACCGDAYHLLKRTFPHLTVIWFEDYHIKYTKGKNLASKIFFQTPEIFLRILVEHRKLKNLIREYHIDTVISDNRFGLWNKKVRSVYITHQVHIKAPGNNKAIEKFLFRIHRYFINKYDVCCIPDFSSGFRLAGELSDKYGLTEKARYIGILSRFSAPEKEMPKDFDLCVLISGPEPQRSIFQEIILGQLQRSSFSAVVVLGKPAENFNKIIDGRIRLFSSLPPNEIQDYIQRSGVVLARSGYSTIMDLATLGKRAILVPTPGQTEQEYLANYLSGQSIFYTTTQNDFNLETAFDKVKETAGVLNPSPKDLLEKVILDSI